MLLDDYCDINTTSANSTNWDSATKWNNVVNFIIKVPMPIIANHW